MPTCTKCKHTKPETEFNIYLGKITKQCSRCNTRGLANYRKNFDRCKEQRRTSYLKRKATGGRILDEKRRVERRYGLFPDQKDILIEAQDSRCAICKQKFKVLCVDHDHKTGKLRAMLCKPCNLGLGNFRENRDSLKTAIDYLNYWDNWK